MDSSTPRDVFIFILHSPILNSGAHKSEGGKCIYVCIFCYVINKGKGINGCYSGIALPSRKYLTCQAATDSKFYT